MEFLKRMKELREKGINYGSKLENERRLNERRYENIPTTDMGLKRGHIIAELRKERDSRLNMSDTMKPIFRINSLDKQNNDPLKTGSIDSFRGATDVKPLPSETLMGTIGRALPSTN